MITLFIFNFNFHTWSKPLSPLSFNYDYEKEFCDETLCCGHWSYSYRLEVIIYYFQQINSQSIKKY